MVDEAFGESHEVKPKLAMMHSQNTGLIAPETHHRFGSVDPLPFEIPCVCRVYGLFSRLVSYTCTPILPDTSALRCWPA